MFAQENCRGKGQHPEEEGRIIPCMCESGAFALESFWSRERVILTILTEFQNPHGLYLGTFETSLLTKASLQQDTTAVAALPHTGQAGRVSFVQCGQQAPVCSSSCSKNCHHLTPAHPPPEKRVQFCAKHKLLQLKSQSFSLQTVWANSYNIFYTARKLIYIQVYISIYLVLSIYLHFYLLLLLFLSGILID